MLDYYNILGVESTASTAEIKVAFRTLAKLYHPDKNENGKEFFTTILKAYETLCNNHSRSRYDVQYYRFKNAATTQTTEQNVKASKTWRFDDKELKRRQYYNEHFKKQMENNPPLSETEINKTNYNEFKYIFYAIPLAVILFLLIVKFTQNNSRYDVVNHPNINQLK